MTDVRPDEPAAIELRGLTKRFGDALALDGVDLVVRPGVVFGFLGRNGGLQLLRLGILHRPSVVERLARLGLVPAAGVGARPAAADLDLGGEDGCHGMQVKGGSRKKQELH